MLSNTNFLNRGNNVGSTGTPDLRTTGIGVVVSNDLVGGVALGGWVTVLTNTFVNILQPVVLGDGVSSTSVFPQKTGFNTGVTGGSANAGVMGLAVLASPWTEVQTPTAAAPGAKGQLIFDTTNSQMKYWDGIAWIVLSVLPGPKVVKTTADQSIATSTLTLVSDLAFDVAANSYYHFRFILLIQSNTATVGVSSTVTVPTFTTFGATASSIYTVAGAGASWFGAITGSGVPVTPPDVAAVDTSYVLVIEGTLLPNATGTVQVKVAREASTGTVKVMRGSAGLLTRL